jgi:hypothetical protein
VKSNLNNMAHHFRQPSASQVQTPGRSGCSQAGRLALTLPARESRQKPRLRYDDPQKWPKRRGPAPTRQNPPCLGRITSPEIRFCGPADRHPSGVPFPAAVQSRSGDQAGARLGTSGNHRHRRPLESAKTRGQDRVAANHFAADQARCSCRRVSAATGGGGRPVATRLNSGCSPAYNIGHATLAGGAA